MYVRDRTGLENVIINWMNDNNIHNFTREELLKFLTTNRYLELKVSDALRDLKLYCELKESENGIFTKDKFFPE